MKYEKGDIVLINVGDERRFVIILMTPDEDYNEYLPEQNLNPIYNVALTNNEFDLITDQDVHLYSEEVGLPFPLVVLGLVGPVRVEEHAVPLDRIIKQGKVIPEVFKELRPFIYLGEVGPLLSSRRGMPLRGEADPRWKFVEDELHLMQKVFAPWED